MRNVRLWSRFDWKKERRAAACCFQSDGRAHPSSVIATARVHYAGLFQKWKSSNGRRRRRHTKERFLLLLCVFLSFSLYIREGGGLLLLYTQSESRKSIKEPRSIRFVNVARFSLCMCAAEALFFFSLSLFYYLYAIGGGGVCDHPMKRQRV